jgi:hypothetical protein
MFGQRRILMLLVTPHSSTDLVPTFGPLIPAQIWCQRLGRSFQHRFGANVWAGIVDDYVIGPFVIHDRLSGVQYTDFLEETLLLLLENVLLRVRESMWFQLGAPPPHFARRVGTWLDKFPDRWTGCGGPIS